MIQPKIDYPLTYLEALKKTKGHEGIYSADKLDPGGETFVGITRVYWPHWKCWPIIDKWLKEGGDPPDLTEEIREFYFLNYWCRFQGDVIAEISEPIAHTIFDIAVNRGVETAVMMFQDALSLLNRNGRLYIDLALDGELGPLTLNALRQLLRSRPPTREESELLLLQTFVLLSGGHTISKFRENPEKEKYVGWIRRAFSYIESGSNPG